MTPRAPSCRRPILAALALCVVALVGSTARAAPTRVGIVVNLRVNVGADEADELATALGVAIRKRHGVDVVAGGEASRRLPKEIKEDCVASRECVEELASRLDADQLLFLVLVRVGETIQIDSTWVDPRTGRTLSRDAIQLDKSDTPYSKFKEASITLLPGARKAEEPPEAPKLSRRAPPRRVVTDWVPFATAASLSGAALIGGLALAIGQRAEYDALALTGCADVECHAGAREQIEGLGRRTILPGILFGTAALAAVGAVVFYTTRESPLDVALSVSPDGAHFAIGGSL